MTGNYKPDGTNRNHRTKVKMSIPRAESSPQIIPSVPNLRDLGGHVTRDGGRTRSGLLYRSEQLSAITDHDMPALANLGLKKIYDLRTAVERAAGLDRVPAAAQDVVEDIMADEQQAAAANLFKLFEDPAKANAMLGDGRAAAMFHKVYIDLVSLPSARNGYSEMFTEIAEPDNLPALFHCTTGKDRTGWAAAALLLLLGVPEEGVMKDYLASNNFVLPEYQSLIDKYTSIGVEREILLSILGVRREYLETSLQEMRDQYGSIEEYFSKGLDIGAAGQQALCERFLE
jgi:protein-tyrosine phosphatase